MNIDFIKWLVRYAEGFEINNLHHVYGYERLHLKFTEQGTYESVIYPKPYNKPLIYPLLLQRAIEGINKKRESLYWFNQSDDITAWIYGKEPKIFRNENIDQAKEKALKYIWEQGI